MAMILVGGGQASASCAAKLRALGYEGELVIVGEEPYLPYQRPPLSKKYLRGDMEMERLFLRPQSFYDEAGIEVKKGVKATAIDRAAKQVALSDGRALAYEKLLLATGSIPRRLPDEMGGALDGVYSVRGLADIDAMRPAFTKGKKLVIIGGGYIGLEAASVGVQLGLDVTLIELAPRILQRVAAEQSSDFIREYHCAHGVKIMENTALAQLNGADGRLVSVRLKDGSMLDADLAIVGIGVVPADGLAQQAGLACENGVAVNAYCATTDADIYAAGDCASFPYRGGRIRLESVPNAIDMGELAARNMLGEGQEYIAKPWFWSDQFDLVLQIAGLNSGYDRTYLRPSEKEGRCSIWYYRGDELLAVDAMGDPRAYMVGKRLIENGKSPDPAQITDPACNLKTLL